MDQFSSLPNDKMFDRSKLKAFADDTIKVAKIMIFVFDGVENIVGKGENAGYQHFLLFPQSFQDFLLRVVKSWDCACRVQICHLVKKLEC